MCAHITDKKPNLLASILQNKCPRCRRGNIFKYSNPYNLKHFTEMNDHCSVCGQDLEMEIGFYYGTGYVSYALTVAISVASLIAWWLIVGLSLYDNRLFWWLAFNAVLLVLLQPPLMRLSRTIWRSFFVRYKPAHLREPMKTISR